MKRPKREGQPRIGRVPNTMYVPIASKMLTFTFHITPFTELERSKRKTIRVWDGLDGDA